MFKYIFRILAVLIIWRAAISVFAYVGHDINPDYKPSFPYYERFPEYGPWWITRWAGFDGVHYKDIIEHGYKGIGLIQAFFPLYPYTARFFLGITQQNPIYAGLLVSHLCFILGIFVYIAWLRELRLPQRQQMLALVLLLTFPASHSYVAMYTESIFLLLSGLVLWAFQKKAWWIVFLSGGLLSATRVVGVLLAPAVFLRAFRERTWRSKFFIVAISAGMTFGLIGYSYFLWKNYDDPLYFFHVQEAFNTGRQSSLVLLPQVLFRSVKILVSLPWNSRPWYVAAQDLYMFLLLFSLLASATWRWYQKKKLPIPAELLIFAWASLFVPTMTGTLQSMTRYGLSILPIFPLLVEVLDRHPRAKIFIILLHVILLSVNTMLFIQGRFVS